MQKNCNGAAVQRPDMQIIIEHIKSKSRVLDLGCGDGTLLRLLKEKKLTSGLGIEGSHSKVIETIQNGVPVIHGDLNQCLEFVDKKSFDYVILSRTLQEVERPDTLLKVIVDVGKRGLVSFLNFGHYKNRLQLLFGQMPENKNLPHKWYKTPNIHLGTINDFKNLCQSLNIEICKTIPVNPMFPMASKLSPNLFATTCVFEIQQKT